MSISERVRGFSEAASIVAELAVEVSADPNLTSREREVLVAAVNRLRWRFRQLQEAS